MITPDSRIVDQRLARRRLYQHWEQQEDGSYATNLGGGPAHVGVTVRKLRHNDVPLIFIEGFTANLDPTIARWLSLRLAEASVISELELAAMDPR